MTRVHWLYLTVTDLMFWAYVSANWQWVSFHIPSVWYYTQAQPKRVCFHWKVVGFDCSCCWRSSVRFRSFLISFPCRLFRPTITWPSTIFISAVFEANSFIRRPSCSSIFIKIFWTYFGRFVTEGNWLLISSFLFESSAMKSSTTVSLQRLIFRILLTVIYLLKSFLSGLTIIAPLQFSIVWLWWLSAVR